MSAVYNEINHHACEWLENLIVPQLAAAFVTACRDVTGGPP